MFEIKEKVAIVTGGASGIGYACVKEFLKKGLKGVTIVDINKIQGDKSLVELEQEFGPNKVIFVCADVSDTIQLKEAFEKTVAVFKQLDILVNNAGIVNEINWEKCIAVNLVAVIEGCTLAMDEFFPKYKSGEEGVIINVSSISALKLYESLVVYSASKWGVTGYTRVASITYSETKNVRIIAICPGSTDTPTCRISADEIPKQYLDLITKTWSKHEVMQSADVVAAAVIKLIESASSGSVWKITKGKLTETEQVPRGSLKKDSLV